MFRPAQARSTLTLSPTLKRALIVAPAWLGCGRRPSQRRLQDRKLHNRSWSVIALSVLLHVGLADGPQPLLGDTICWGEVGVNTCSFQGIIDPDGRISAVHQ